ncbi:MAG: hypothetical protein U9N49_02890 [Campylobacterota bacterium]|nr:hypothetical protein [Campylobacterota bacterium]
MAFHESDEWLGDKIAELQTLEGFEAFGSWQGFRGSVAFALGKFIAMPVGIVGGGLLEFWRTELVLWLHDSTIIEEQLEAYISSIQSGRGVVVVSHGFGNTFTAKMFDKLGEEGEGNNIGWMQNYFHEIAVAPSESTVANNIYSVAFDNDLIWYEYPIQNYMAHYRILTNPNRRDVFVKVDDEYGEIYSDNGEYGEIALDLKSAQYHKFAYYLGYPVYEEALIDESNTTTEVKLRQTNLAKDSIQSSIHYEIIKHQERESQWQYDTNSSNSKVFLKHRVTIQHPRKIGR